MTGTETRDVWAEEIVPASNRIARHIRRAPHLEMPTPALPLRCRRLVLVAEHLQYTGSHRVRAALNYLLVSRATLPQAGIVVPALPGRTSDVLAWAWAAGKAGIASAVVVSAADTMLCTALRQYRSQVIIAPGGPDTVTEYCDDHRRRTGAQVPDYTDPLIATGAGSLVPELVSGIDALTTIIIPGTDPTLTAGATAAVAGHPGVRLVVATIGGRVGDRRGPGRGWPITVDVTAGDIGTARNLLYRRDYRVGTEGALALAALTAVRADPARGYTPGPHETVAVVLSKADTTTYL
ncbi:pyridoxal-phosphate dependent enzyme [Nocardia sp. alder85J]|uniref:pyridoxal-phosphate dependent enzyme n=1 Tax=Nocardia sp. alder85J TaxID=2862949 RepID=UPI00224F4111|nr:pyridoxal-phosphate dependent enzyme [Nocardia sp. alder85J]MCX4099144.1 pyridoxal-phosphate dependent enzyme [Nocardia sp. alder85J]